MANFFTTGQSMFGSANQPTGTPIVAGMGNANNQPTGSGGMAPPNIGMNQQPQAPAQPQGSNVVGAQAVRPGTTAPNMPGVGQFDPGYLQNLATYVGGLFQRPANGQPLSFNPLGNLSDIFGGQKQGTGNDPTLGLPQTLTQGAINQSLSSPTPYVPPPPDAATQAVQARQKQQAGNLGDVATTANPLGLGI